MKKAVSLSRPQLVIAFAAVNLVIAIGGWMLLISPQSSRASSAALDLAQAQSNIAQIGSGPSRQIQPVIRTAMLYRLAQAMPASESEPDLMLFFDHLAQSEHLKMLGISPGTASATAVGFTQLPLTLTVSGTYGDITRFLARLRGLVSVHGSKLHVAGPLTSVGSVGLTPSSDSKVETGLISLDAYYYGAVAGATPPPAATTSTTTTTTTGG